MRGRLKGLKVLAFVAIAFAAMAAGEISQAVAESWLTPHEDRMVSMLNQHRTGHGRSALSNNAALRMMARRQAQRMQMSGYIYHNPNLRREADRAVPGWLSIGENVGVGPSMADIQQAFLDSPPHHANIDDRDYNIVGIGGIASDSESVYFTQNYALLRARSSQPSTARRNAGVVRAAPKPSRPTPRSTPAKPSPSPSLSPSPTRSPVDTQPATEEIATSGSDDAGVSLPAGLVAMVGHAGSQVMKGLDNISVALGLTGLAVGYMLGRRRLHDLTHRLLFHRHSLP